MTNLLRLEDIAPGGNKPQEIAFKRSDSCHLRAISNVYSYEGWFYILLLLSMEESIEKSATLPSFMLTSNICGDAGKVSSFVRVCLYRKIGTEIQTNRNHTSGTRMKGGLAL